MKLLELEARKFRGIVHLLVTPEGENLLLLGPNGSGKSAVVDALDFVLTGGISRLTGPGTGGITLAKHGHHVDHPAAETEVRAVFQLPGVDRPIELRRRLDAAGDVLCDDGDMPLIAPLLDLAAMGQHLLTRRQLLDFVVSEPANRGAALGALLKLDQVRELRSTLVQVGNELRRQTKALEAARETALAALARTLGTNLASRSVVMAETNRLRTLLGGPPLEAITSHTVKHGVTAPLQGDRGKILDLAVIRRDGQTVLEPISGEARNTIASLNADLHSLLNSFRTNPGLIRALQRKQLIELGVSLLDETGLCPLCDYRWDAVELRGYLQGKREAAVTAAAKYERVTGLTSTLLSRINRVYVSLAPLISVSASVGATQEGESLRRWQTELSELQTALQTPLDAYSEARFSSGAVAVLLAPESLPDVVTSLVNAAAAKSPEPTPEQRAWDQLTRIEENLKAGEDLATRLKVAETGERRADALLVAFEAARDWVLESLYEAVKDRFVELYRAVHDTDESSFEAMFEPEGAGMRFEVGFHGRGMHPPHALHSEGHQDTMGLCLFLALAEHLTPDHIGFLILDDVLMSVDADHRHRVAKLLGSRMRGRQLIITTHDRNWANQLRWAGVVPGKRLIEFRGWDIGSGPIVAGERDVWERIRGDLRDGDPSAAAARLRRWAEEFFANLCDTFEGKPAYHLHGRYELGEYSPAAIASLRKAIATAKQAANSWNRQDHVDALGLLEKKVSDALRTTKAEEWTINAAVHYNTWATMTSADLGPVADAYKTLEEACSCSACGSLLQLAYRGKTAVMLTCPCGAVAFGLSEKPRE